MGCRRLHGGLSKFKKVLVLDKVSACRLPPSSIIVAKFLFGWVMTGCRAGNVDTIVGSRRKS